MDRGVLLCATIIIFGSGLFVTIGGGMLAHAVRAVALCALVFCFFVAFVQEPWRKKKAAAFVDRSRSVVDFSFFGDSLSQEERLALRSNNNQRLVRVFGIHNSLTTYDVSHHRCFLSAARGLASKKDGWQALYSHCDTNIREIVARHTPYWRRSDQDEEPRFPILLAPLVQHVCFRGALKALFGDSATMDLIDEDVQIITADINMLWVKSKDPAARPDSTRLRELLSRATLPSISPGKRAEMETAEEALGIILPAYE